jgi:hypothetical protein
MLFRSHSCDIHLRVSAGSEKSHVEKLTWEARDVYGNQTFVAIVTWKELVDRSIATGDSSAAEIIRRNRQKTSDISKGDVNSYQNGDNY